MKPSIFPLVLVAALSTAAFWQWPDPPAEFVQFKFKGKTVQLTAKMDVDLTKPTPKIWFLPETLDTMSNQFQPEKHYVEIVRQDDPYLPKLGLAFGFEFDEANGEYPYTPARAVFQLKDFGYGGLEFGRRDTCNFTGISNAVSDDVTLEITGFSNDTISGTFSGLLLSGSGGMASLDSGVFKIRLLRK